MSHTYEVEIKSLLGSKEAAEKLKSNLQAAYPDTKLVGKGKQLNHYFNTPADTSKLITDVEALVPAEKKASFEKILKEGKKISLRTRDADGTVILVMKASVGDDSSSNGVTRIEFESKVNKTLAELDQLLLDAGATYQAKWSREREEYESGGMHICLDKNAGYGYLAEFERVTPDESSLGQVKSDLLSVMQKLGVSELPQDRLERMFAHYNANWNQYYGTENTFNID
jgi:predicted adenylyl cyclase CyaB